MMWTIACDMIEMTNNDNDDDKYDNQLLIKSVTIE